MNSSRSASKSRCSAAAADARRHSGTTNGVVGVIHHRCAMEQKMAVAAVDSVVVVVERNDCVRLRRGIYRGE